MHTFILKLLYALQSWRGCESTQLKLIHQLFYYHSMMFLFGAKASDSKKYTVLSQSLELRNERRFEDFLWKNYFIMSQITGGKNQSEVAFFTI